jgi:hypothetical protein
MSYLSLGAELFYGTSLDTDAALHFGFNIGSIINITENHHILLSAGTDIIGPTGFSWGRLSVKNLGDPLGEKTLAARWPPRYSGYFFLSSAFSASVTQEPGAVALHSAA